MEEWKESIIEQTSIQMIDGDRGKNYPKNSDFFSQGYCLFLNAGNVTKSGFSFSDNAFITEDKDQLLRKGRLERNDVVITTRGTVGNVALYDSSVPYEHIRINSGMLILKGGRDILPEYLYYFLKGSRFQTQIDQFVSGSAQPQLPKSTLGKMKISFPVELNVQKRICGVLKSLDEKIEVNRRINDNLEQQAQALFKSWFVDFEPFRDQPFVESELGMIPEGWREGKLGELCQFKRGKGLLSKNAIPGDVPVVAGGLGPSCYHDVSNTKAPVITISGSGANAGFMRMYHQEVWASDCSFIDVTCENWLFVYCFLAINSHLLKHAQTGAVQPHVKPADIHDFDLVIPPHETIQKFQNTISSFIRKKGIIEQESRRLAQLRDTLLPRLMSGEIKVGDVTL